MPSTRDRFFGMLEKGVGMGAEGAKAAQEAQLRELLQQKQAQAQMDQVERQASLKQQGEEAAVSRQSTKLRELMGQYPGRAVNVEGITVGAPQDPTLRNMRADQRTDTALTQMGRRIDQENIPAQFQTHKELEASLPPEGQPLKSYGPYMNILPDWAVSAAEGVSDALEPVGVPRMVDKGAGQERQAMEMARSQVRKGIFGQSLTGTEKASADSALGAKIGQSEENLRNTVKRLKDLPNASLKNIESSTPAEAVVKYRSQGGLRSDGGPSAPPSDPRRARLEELRRKAGRR